MCRRSPAPAPPPRRQPRSPDSHRSAGPWCRKGGHHWPRGKGDSLILAPLPLRARSLRTELRVVTVACVMLPGSCPLRGKGLESTNRTLSQKSRGRGGAKGGQRLDGRGDRGEGRRETERGRVWTAGQPEGKARWVCTIPGPLPVSWVTWALPASVLGEDRAGGTAAPEDKPRGPVVSAGLARLLIQE